MAQEPGDEARLATFLICTAQKSIQWNLYNVVTLGPTFYGCNIEDGCIIQVHNVLAICTVGPIKVALIER